MKSSYFSCGFRLSKSAHDTETEDERMVNEQPLEQNAPTKRQLEAGDNKEDTARQATQRLLEAGLIGPPTNKTENQTAKVETAPPKESSPTALRVGLHADLNGMQVAEVAAGPKAAPTSSSERMTYVLGRGLARAPEGVINAVVHDIHNPAHAAAKLGIAASIGVVMKAALPKTGVGKAIVGTVMLGAMARDLVRPFAESISTAGTATDMDTLDKAATNLGNGLGMFAWDTAAGGVVGLKAEKMTGRFLESRLGTARYAAFENAKVDFFSSDEYLVGRTLNRIAKPVDTWTAKTADRLAPKEQEIKVTPEAIHRMADAHAKHAANYKSVEMYLNGVAGVDGKAHGYSQTLDLMELGLDPRKVSSDDAARLLASRTGKGSEARNIIGNNKDHFKGEDGDHVPGSKPEPGDAAKVPDAVKPGDVPVVVEAAPAVGKYVTKAEQELNVNTVSKLAEMNKQDMAGWTDEAVMVQDALGQMIGPMHAATTPSYKPLDPGYIAVRNAMVQIGNQVKGQADLQHVYPLFNRAWMAANQHIGMGLSEVNGWTHEFNLFGREIHSSLMANMKRHGIDTDTVLRSKNPPLFSISADGGAGPHTMRQIDGVWPLDHVLYPRNMVGTRSVTASGIYGHEIGHDQYGGILKFDESIREQVIKDAVKNGLLALEKKLYGTETGKIAAEKVAVPGHGEMTKADLYENIFKAQADENTADIWGAAWTGHNGGGALGILLQSLRSGGKLETRNVYGKEFVDAVENPLGFEVHAFDALRPKIVAETMRARANGDKRVLDHADALERYGHEASRPGDYVFANIDAPTDRIVIPRQELEAVVPELIKAQMNTPLPALQGKTFGDVLPDLPSHMAKMDTLAELMADAVLKGKKPSEIPFDTNQYTINQVFGAGMPAALKLVAGGMDAVKANAEVNRMSDFLRSQFHANDPHISPLRPTSLQAIRLNSPRSFVEGGRILGSEAKHAASRILRANPAIRDYIGQRAPIFGGAEAAITAERLMGDNDKTKETATVMDMTPKPPFVPMQATGKTDWLSGKDSTLRNILFMQKASRDMITTAQAENATPQPENLTGK
ncbi:MAG TPA: hypothetical protein PLC15_17370 [Candidatus Obscuribacter sp.]|nr:hypothetical protein [Candidatus Obscuribacter sp.]